MIQCSPPNASLTSIRELVQMLALISEGRIVLYSTGGKHAVKHKRIIELVTPLLRIIAPGV